MTLSAFVKSEFDVKPPLLSFGEPHTGDSPTRTVRVIPLNKNPIKINDIEYNKDILEITKKQEGLDWLITAKLISGGKTGFLKDKIFIVTDSKHMPRLKVPVRAVIKGYIQHSPDYLEFGAVSSGSKSLMNSFQ